MWSTTLKPHKFIYGRLFLIRLYTYYLLVYKHACSNIFWSCCISRFFAHNFFPLVSCSPNLIDRIYFCSNKFSLTEFGSAVGKKRRAAQSIDCCSMTLNASGEVASAGWWKQPQTRSQCGENYERTRNDEMSKLKNKYL